MKKVTIWNYFAISKQTYLSMSEKEKRERISKYYSDMKSRQSTGKPYKFFIYLFCFCLNMFHPKLDWLLMLWEELGSFSKDANDYILEHCFYCKKCRACSINSSLVKELKRNKFKSENKKVQWCRLQFVDDDQVILSKNL